jgi:glycosyltransferase involved in cell wall biosynthesis
MSANPLVSVILPARNCGDLLNVAVASILDQTLTDLELIVIDDGSDDGSLQKLPSDPRLRIVANSGLGLVDALNHGAGIARGIYLARMDGDDIALPQRLERQIALLEAEPEIGIAGAQVEIFSDDGEPGGGYRHYQDWINGLTRPEAINREIFIESPIPHPTAVLRRTVFVQLGGYRKRVWAEDYDLWLRAFAAGIAMAKPDGILLRWRDHPGRLSRNDPLYHDTAFIQARAHFLARTILTRRSVIIWGAGDNGTALFDALLREHVEAQVFFDVDAKKIGRSRRGKPILSWQAAAGFDQEVILVAVRKRGIREQIRTALLEMGKIEGRDFWFAA